MIVNIIMFFTMYPVLLVLYFCFRGQYQYANGCLFAVNMKPEWIKEPKVQEIVEKFQTEMKRYVIILMLVPFTSFFTKYMSIQLTIWMMWILLVIGLLCLPLIHANGALKKWKREQKLYDSAVMEHYVELKAVGKVRRVKFLTFFLPNLVGLVISLMPLLVKIIFPDFAKNLELGSVSWLCVIMWLCGLLLWVCAVWMDKQPVAVISSDSDINLNFTRAKKNIWKKFWLAANWMNTLFLFTIPASALWIADMGMSVMIASVVYTLLICGLAVLLMRQMKNVEHAYEGKQDLTASEADDRRWIGGIFYYNPEDRHSMVTKKVGIGTTMNLATPLGKGMTIFSVIVLIVTIPAMCIWLIMLDFTPIRLQVENQTLYAKHLNVDYEIDVTDIENLDKITELPSWSKSYGTAMDTLEKGTFFIRNVGKCEVFLNPENTEFLHFTADGTDYYMSGYDDAQTEEIYQIIQNRQ